jgi:hypothetical protein
MVGKWASLDEYFSRNLLVLGMIYFGLALPASALESSQGRLIAQSPSNSQIPDNRDRLIQPLESPSSEDLEQLNDNSKSPLLDQDAGPGNNSSEADVEPSLEQEPSETEAASETEPLSESEPELPEPEAVSEVERFSCDPFDLQLQQRLNRAGNGEESRVNSEGQENLDTDSGTSVLNQGSDESDTSPEAGVESSPEPEGFSEEPKFVVNSIELLGPITSAANIDELAKQIRTEAELLLQGQAWDRTTLGYVSDCITALYLKEGF